MPKIPQIPPSGVTMTIRLPQELIDSLKAIAADHCLSMHSYVRMVLSQHVKSYPVQKEKENG